MLIQPCWIKNQHIQNLFYGKFGKLSVEIDGEQVASCTYLRLKIRIGLDNQTCEMDRRISLALAAFRKV